MSFSREMTETLLEGEILGENYFLITEENKKDKSKMCSSSYPPRQLVENDGFVAKLWKY